MKLYVRKETKQLDALLKEMLEALLSIMEEHVDTYMPGFTHLQKAQPITLAHHMERILKCSGEIMRGWEIF